MFEYSIVRRGWIFVIYFDTWRKIRFAMRVYWNHCKNIENNFIIQFGMWLRDVFLTIFLNVVIIVSS